MALLKHSRPIATTNWIKVSDNITKSEVTLFYENGYVELDCFKILPF
jgi:hypothetical protein